MMEFIKKYDLIPKALSVVVAILMWMYVIADQNPLQTKKYIDIGVQMVGIEELNDDGLSIIEGANSTVEVNLRGKRDKMLQVYVDKISVMVNLSSITSPGEYKLPYTVLVDVDGVTVLHKVPEQITLQVDRIVSKSVPVDLQLKGTAPEGFVVGDYKISPDAITIKGPESVLKNVDHAHAEVDISQMKQDTNTTVPITLINNDNKPTDMALVTVNKPSVDVTIPVHQAGMVPFVIDLEPLIGLNITPTYKIEPESILVNGSTDIIAKLNSINLGSVNAAELLATGKTEIALPVILPNGVSAQEPIAKATVKFDFSAIKEKTIIIPASKFTAHEGFGYTETQLEISVIGSEKDLVAVNEDSFTVDFNAEEIVQNGAHTVDAIVKTNAIGVVVIKEYKLEVNREIE